MPEEGHCAPEIPHTDFNDFISLESRDLPGFYCRASVVYNIMLF